MAFQNFSWVGQIAFYLSNKGEIKKKINLALTEMKVYKKSNEH